MSIECVSAVVESNDPQGGNRLLILWLLAYYARRDGSEIRPSMATLAKKARCSPVQARRIVHDLMQDGLLELVANANGGAPGASRVYRLRLDRLLPARVEADTTPTSERGTALTDERGTALMDDRDGSHGRSRRLSPVRANPSLSVRIQKGPTSSATDAAPISQSSGAKPQHRSPPPTTAITARETVWGLGVSGLVGAGMAETSARSFLGRMAKLGEGKLAQAIAAAATGGKLDPRAYIAAAMQPKKREAVL